ncbi:MAG: CxxC-x17-CxxC domain-containing protein [bacterium]
MKKRFKRKSLLITPQEESGVTGLINKVQQQLSAIEKRLDILISQSSKKPFERSYSQKPSRSLNHSHRRDRTRQGDGSRERTYTKAICADCNKECEIPFKPSGDRPVYCRECFPKHKKGNLFRANRDSRPKERDFPRKHRFDKRQTAKRQKPVKNKKPFFTRIKKRT